MTPSKPLYRHYLVFGSWDPRNSPLVLTYDHKCCLMVDGAMCCPSRYCRSCILIQRQIED